jgi:hypothetical protein
MGSQVPAAPGLSDEQIAALLQQVQQNQASGAMPAAVPTPQMPAVPLPQVPVQPQAQGGIMEMLKGLFMGGTSAKELAGPQAPVQPLTPMELQQRRQRMMGQ